MAVVALTACGSSKERKMAPDSGIHHFREVEEVNLPEEEIAKADFVKMPGGVSVLYGRRRGSGETEDRTIYGFNAGMVRKRDCWIPWKEWKVKYSFCRMCV